MAVRERLALCARCELSQGVRHPAQPRRGRQLAHGQPDVLCHAHHQPRRAHGGAGRRRPDEAALLTRVRAPREHSVFALPVSRGRAREARRARDAHAAQAGRQQHGRPRRRGGPERAAGTTRRAAARAAPGAAHHLCGYALWRAARRHRAPAVRGQRRDDCGRRRVARQHQCRVSVHAARRGHHGGEHVATRVSQLLAACETGKRWRDEDAAHAVGGKRPGVARVAHRARGRPQATAHGARPHRPAHRARECGHHAAAGVREPDLLCAGPGALRARAHGLARVDARIGTRHRSAARADATARDRRGVDAREAPDAGLAKLAHRRARAPRLFAAGRLLVPGTVRALLGRDRDRLRGVRWARLAALGVSQPALWLCARDDAAHDLGAAGPGAAAARHPAHAAAAPHRGVRQLAIAHGQGRDADALPRATEPRVQHQRLHQPRRRVAARLPCAARLAAGGRAHIADVWASVPRAASETAAPRERGARRQSGQKEAREIGGGRSLGVAVQ